VPGSKVVSYRTRRLATSKGRESGVNREVPVSYSRREVVANMGAVLWLGGIRSSYASEPSLEFDQGIVICGLRTDFPTSFVEFRQFHSRLFFDVSPEGVLGRAPKPVIAKLGQYYLYTIDQPYANVAKPPNREPVDERGTFEVLNGAVTYVGDWFVRFYGAEEEVAVNPKTILRAKTEYPWLEKYQLFVSLKGREPQPLAWEQVRESEGS
jgi:hypothetical protein